MGFGTIFVGDKVTATQLQKFKDSTADEFVQWELALVADVNSGTVVQERRPDSVNDRDHDGQPDHPRERYEYYTLQLSLNVDTGSGKITNMETAKSYLPRHGGNGSGN